MAHYAIVDADSLVTQVFVGKNEHDPLPEGIVSWEHYYGALRTSYNTRGGVHYGDDGVPSEDQSKAFRLNYAGIGYRYDADLNGFIPPKPYPSWLLNAASGLWEPPVPMPTDGKRYDWDEANQLWDLIVES